MPGRGAHVVTDDALAIEKQVVGITGVSAEQAPAPQTVKANNVSLDLDPAHRHHVIIPLRARLSRCRGRYFNNDEDERKSKVVVLGSGLAKDLFGVESPLGQTVTIGTIKFTVMGVMSSQGIVADVDYDGRVYLPTLPIGVSKIACRRQRSAVIACGQFISKLFKKNFQGVITQKITSLMATRHEVPVSKPDFTVQT